MSTPPKPLPPPLPTVPVSSPFSDKDTDSQVSFPWMNFFLQLQALVLKLSKTPGPYSNDAAAAAKGVRVGEQYYQPSGTVSVRET